LEKALKYFQLSAQCNKRYSGAYRNIAITYRILAKHETNDSKRQILSITSETNEAKAQNLGICDPPSPDYWKEEKTDNSKQEVITTKTNGVEQVVPVDYAQKIQKLEEKYKDYFN